MRFVWLIPLTILIAGAGVFFRVRRRAKNPPPLTSEPVSGEWLAEARGREENRW